MAIASEGATSCCPAHSPSGHSHRQVGPWHPAVKSKACPDLGSALQHSGMRMLVGVERKQA